MPPSDRGVAGLPVVHEPTPPPVPPRHRRVPVSKLWWITGPLLAVLVGAIVVTGSMTMPYYTFSPGQARAVGPLVEIDPVKGGPEVPDEEVGDDILFVTVSSRQPSGFQLLDSLGDDTVQILPEEIVTGGQSPSQNRTFNLQLMTDSKDKAAKVALERAGFEVPVRATGAVITDASPDLPVAKVVVPGETVVRADGTPIRTAKDLVAVIGRHQPGDTVTLVVEPFGPGRPRTVHAKLAERPGEPGKPLLGVTLEDRPEYDFPMKVEIDSDRVGGPSAGLAFTLAVLDRLTPGRLTGDGKVAVTGTINLDGSVGPVGGVRQKTEAAIREGATVFIVPSDEYHDAKDQARGRIAIRRADSLDEALKILEERGGGPVEPVAHEDREGD